MAREAVAARVLAQTVDKLAIVRPDRLADMHHQAAFRMMVKQGSKEGRTSFLKKRSKKLLLHGLSLLDAVLEGAGQASQPWTKVFCFFFSKKKSLLAFIGRFNRPTPLGVGVGGVL